MQQPASPTTDQTWVSPVEEAVGKWQAQWGGTAIATWFHRQAIAWIAGFTNACAMKKVAVSGFKLPAPLVNMNKNHWVLPEFCARTFILTFCFLKTPLKVKEFSISSKQETKYPDTEIIHHILSLPIDIGKMGQFFGK